MFFCFSLILVFGFFEKKQVFVSFLEKNAKIYSELFLLHHAISPFSELYNNNFYTYYGIQN